MSQDSVVRKLIKKHAISSKKNRDNVVFTESGILEFMWEVLGLKSAKFYEELSIERAILNIRIYEDKLLFKTLLREIKPNLTKDQIVEQEFKNKQYVLPLDVV